MAANSSAHPARAGFNQSGGAYFLALSDLANTATGAATLTYTITTAATGSGGATVPPVFTVTSMENIMKAGVTDANLSAVEAAGFVAAGKLIKDMGKTVVDASGRTFRKFAVAATGAAFVSSTGVVGNPAAAPNVGYGSFYLEVTRNAATAGAAPAPIIRYF